MRPFLRQLMRALSAKKMKLELGNYVLEVDSERTKNTYLEIQKGGAEICGCSYCQNYIATFLKSFPDEVLHFFSYAGVDPHKDAEIFEQGEVSPGLRSYGGEYYLWGSIISESKKEQVLNKGFQFVFKQPSPLAQDQFRNEKSLCFYFITELPWVLDDEST